MLKCQISAQSAALGLTQRNVLRECPEFNRERNNILCNVIGVNITIESVVDAFVRDAQTRDAVIKFCDRVMTVKETNGKNRERSDPSRLERRCIRREYRCRRHELVHGYGRAAPA